MLYHAFESVRSYLKYVIANKQKASDSFANKSAKDSKNVVFIMKQMAIVMIPNPKYFIIGASNSSETSFFPQ